MDAEIKELLDQMQLEKDTDQRKIQDIIKDEMSKTKITFNNLSDDLQHTIMEKPSGSGSGSGKSPAPKTPKKRDMPKTDSNIPKSKAFFDIVDDLFVHNNVYLYGQAGTGKTVLAEQVATEICRKDGMYRLGDGEPFYTLNCSQWTSPLQIVGGFSITGYTEGQLELAWKYGGVFIIDELPKLDPNTAGLLNDALAKSAKEEYDENGVLKPVYIVNGKGEKIKKHKDFMVIGTGNTDMKSVSVNFSGNNRQDYSLVDRFVGSMYKIGYDYALEFSLCYSAIIRIGTGLRKALPAESIEAITLRSMLNFNRIYQNQMLRSAESPDAIWPFGVTEEEVEAGSPKMGKKLDESVMSFIESLGDARAQNMIQKATFQSILNPSMEVKLDVILKEAANDKSGFARQYSLFSGRTMNGKDLTTADWEKLQEERDKKVIDIRSRTK